MSRLSQFDRELLTWMQKTLRARKWMKPDAQLSFNRWMENGGKRFEWPGWEILIGPKPGMKKKKSTVTVSIQRRKTA